MGSGILKIGNRNVVTSGSALVMKDEELSISPFPDRPDDTVLFRIEIAEDGSEYSAEAAILDGRLLVVYRRPWDHGTASVNIGIRFEVDEAPPDYGLRFVADFIGSKDQYVTLFSYTIFEGVDHV